MSSPARPLSRSPSLSPIPIDCPPPSSPISRPNSALDKTLRQISLDSPRSTSPNESMPWDNNTLLTTPQDTNDTVHWDEDTATPIAPLLFTPKRFSDPLRSSSPSPVSTSSYSPVVVKRRRLDFSDSGNGMDSDSGDVEVNDEQEKDDSDSSRGFISDEKENESNGNIYEESSIMPQSQAEHFFTVRRSKNLVYFVAPFSRDPMLMKVAFPPTADQISGLLSHGFEHAPNLTDKKRFRNIAFRYELNCSADRRRQLIQFTLIRLERLRNQEFDGMDISALIRDLVEDLRGNECNPESLSDSLSETSDEDEEKIEKRDRIKRQKSLASIKKDTNVKVKSRKTKEECKRKTSKEESSKWTMISNFVKSPFALLSGK